MSENIKLTDMHTHSDRSEDGSFTMSEMALAGVAAGLDIMCVTDHVDIDWFETGIYDPHCFDKWPGMAGDYAEAKKTVDGRLDLRLGIELGEANHRPERSAEIAAEPGIDFIIGALHSVRGYPDCCIIEYKSEEQCREITRLYLEEHLELAKMDCLDVIGHLGYTNRYMRRYGYSVALSDYGDIVHEILRLCVENGRGIEINTSGVRQGSGVTFPGIWELKMYRELGGEIVTVGSDAHFTRDVGADISCAYELIRAVGYDYITVFKNRKPEFLKI